MPNIIWTFGARPAHWRRNGWSRRCSAESLIVYVLLQYDVPGQESGHPTQHTMGSKTDQIKGLANQAVGKVKKDVGKITGSKKTQAKGAAQEVKGKAQQKMGKAKSAVKDMANKVADKANKKL